MTERIGNVNEQKLSGMKSRSKRGPRERGDRSEGVRGCALGKKRPNGSEAGKRWS